MYREMGRSHVSGSRGNLDLGLRLLWLALVGALVLVASGFWDAAPALAAESPLTWSEPLPLEPGAVLKGLSCVSTSLCVAVDNKGQVLTSTNPAAGVGTWSAVDLTEEKSGFPRVNERRS
jgi:hypothetical protein